MQVVPPLNKRGHSERTNDSSSENARMVFSTKAMSLILYSFATCSIQPLVLLSGCIICLLFSIFALLFLFCFGVRHNAADDLC